jgi:tetratricopeptide (TPR) repeat protein
MNGADPPLPEPSPESWDRRQRIIRRFEDAWQRGERPVIEAHLPPGDADRGGLLVELVHAELEFRLKAGEAARVEEYLARFPELAGDTAIVLALLAAEFEQRQRREPGLDPEEVLRRFPDHAAALRQRLSTAPPPELAATGPPLSAAPGGLPLVPGYDVLDMLGRGAMGVVYRARHKHLKRLVALKMILSGADASPDELARFRGEAEALARLQHPHIVQIYDVGEHEGRPYFALELVDGGSLRDRLAGAPLPAAEAAELLRTLALAVHAAHCSGIVHRDLKPGNVLLTADGTPKITDFGVAKRLDEDSGRTHAGDVLGTPSYMAPEQAWGRHKEVGPPADTYALGAVLYDVLTGRPPFRAANARHTVEQVKTEEPVPPRALQPTVPCDLETICLKCLRKEPSQRYASALDLADDLHRFLNGEPIRARPTPGWERAWKWARRRPAAALALTAAGLLLLSAGAGGVAYVLYLRSSAELQNKEWLDRQTADEFLDRARRAIEEKRWPEAKLDVGAARARAGSNPRLAAEQGEAARLQAVLDEHDAARARLTNFRAWRAQALFYGSQFTGLDALSNQKRVRDLAADALQAFGVGEDGEGPPILADRDFEPPEQREVRDGCYELLLLRAEAVARPLPAGENAHRQALLALEILNRAEALRGRPTPASVAERAACAAQLLELPAVAGSVAAVPAPQPAGPLLAMLATAVRVAGVSRAVTGIREQPESAVDHFVLGRLLLGNGDAPPQDLDRAIGHLEGALRAQPDHFWAQYYLAIAHLLFQSTDSPVVGVQHLTAAKAHLTACASINPTPDFPWVAILRGFVNGELGEYAASDDDFLTADDLLETKKKRGDSIRDAQYILRVNRGAMRLQHARALEAAANQVRRVGTLMPGPALLAASLIQAGREKKLEEAAGELELAAAQKPGEIMAHVNLAHVYDRQGKSKEARAEFDSAIQTQPHLAALYRTRARFLLARNDRDGAKADLERAIKDNPARDAWLAEDYTQLGQILYAEKKYDSALAAFDAALAVRGSNLTAHLLRAEVQMELGHYAEALRSFNVYLAAGRPTAGAYRDRAQVRLRLEDYPGAIYDLSRALDLKPDQPADQAALHAERGWVYVALGAAQIARPDFEAAIRLHPDGGEAYAGRGYARVRQGKYLEAVADAQKALDLRPLTQRTCYNAARIYAQAAALAQADQTLPSRMERTRQALSYQQAAVQLLIAAAGFATPEPPAKVWADVWIDPALEPIRGDPALLQARAKQLPGAR